jgi:predicted aldo/keto reductase-like oxidoreductase
MSMLKQTRRQFIQSTLATTAVGIAAHSSLSSAVAAPVVKARSAGDKVSIGKTGITPSFLAQGTGVHGSARSSDHTRMGQQAFDRLLRHSLDHGVSFLDMADLYGTHPFVRQTLKGMPRDKFVYLSKIWPRKENWVTPSTDAVEEINRFRKELGIERLDIALLHCMLNGQWADQYESLRDGLSKLKDEGAVGAVGVSCHNHDALKVAAAHPWVDVIFARINHKGGSEYSCDGTVEEISSTLRMARANGKFVVGMKIFGEGKLTSPEDKDASLRYVTSNNLVDAITIGMRKTEEIDDTVQRLQQALKA